MRFQLEKTPVWQSAVDRIKEANRVIHEAKAELEAEVKRQFEASDMPKIGAILRSNRNDWRSKEGERGTVCGIAYQTTSLSDSIEVSYACKAFKKDGSPGERRIPSWRTNNWIGEA